MKTTSPSGGDSSNVVDATNVVPTKKDTDPDGQTSTDEKNRPPAPVIRNLLLRSMCGVYLVAFLSFYIQAEGLFTNAGILPANRILANGTLQERFNLLQLAPLLGLDTQSAIDLFCLVGCVIAFFGLVFKDLCRLQSFIALWTLYFSLVQITQSFRQQSDELLLEAGFLCILLAPSKLSDPKGPIEDMALLLMKWLLFRFVFASGSVKLASGCPYWWDLSGLKRHFETMPLPTSYSWYTFQQPDGIHKLSTIYVYVSELVCSWLFFAPNQKVRLFSIWWQVFLHLNIIGSGNYGFLSLIVLTLLLSLIDEEEMWKARERESSDKTGGMMVKIFSGVVVLGVWIVFGVGVKDGGLAFKLLFNRSQYLNMMQIMLQLAPLMVIGFMVQKFLKLVAQQTGASNVADGIRKLMENWQLFLPTLAAFAVLFGSIVPHFRLTQPTALTNSILAKPYNGLHSLYVVNQYGQHLVKMRSKRQEIILEYSNDLAGPWSEYGFQYKPWNEEGSMPYAWVYFPRFDFKFYDAVNVKLSSQKWIYSLVQRLLQQQPAVLKLLDNSHIPDKPPKFIRGSIYQFSYTSWFGGNSSTYWTRQRTGDYFPSFSLDDGFLELKLNDIGVPAQPHSSEALNVPLKWLLDAVRNFLSFFDECFLVMGTLAAALIMIITQKQF
ncbi:lipase maturation factor 2-like [Uranotaenia lowii]|uniref:lipase maturation factor 2-like n=1 Tax=Uranotaenia lowii TaxID=190385 RepID=UPI00247B20E2|nr:lipase maturation factor 2-like [Uranotaenia lowii]XP_055595497.1 lipase maturation factor 2-like [Uranotaenia lowii]